ncbi:MAG TPA: DUF4328 domain-containing protein [Bacteroidia bacterium]
MSLVLQLNFVEIMGLDEETFTSSKSKINIFSILKIINLSISVAILILSALWFKRAYHNSHILSEKPKYSISMAGICWFIPIINFIISFQIAIDMINIANDHFIKNGVNEKDLIKKNSVYYWITTKILSKALTFIVTFYPFLLMPSDETMMGPFNIYIINSIINIISVFCFIHYIKTYSKVESRLNELDNGNNINYLSLTVDRI